MVLQKITPFLIGVALIFAIGVSKFYLNPYKSPSSMTYFVSPSPYLEHFTFGYRELVADMLWLRTIQDVDECDRLLKDNETCSNSWVYKMVNKVTDLSPNFRIIYATVPLLLALSVNDSTGALLLLEKGLKHFPNDWPILYRGAYLYLFEAGDKVKAADYFLRAQKNGGPDWLATYAARLYSESGRKELVEQVVKDYEERGFPPGMLQRMRDRLKESAQKIK